MYGDEGNPTFPPSAGGEMKHYFLILLFCCAASLFCLDAYPRYSYSMWGQPMEIIINAMDETEPSAVTVSNCFGISDTIQVKAGKVFSHFCGVAPNGASRCLITVLYHDVTQLVEIPILPPAKSTTRIDALKGILIVDGLPQVPVGFYCYSPVQPTLAEEEICNGFTMMSPYQRLYENRFVERKAYMDRCADLGMKVHYNLCSVAGGGGAGSWKMNKPRPELLRLLKNEVEAFKDHPALLAWYIADEPALHNEDPEWLKEVYNTIKSIDPYHPISMVFMRTSAAEKYADAMDIVMCDPYPVPREPIETVGQVVSRLYHQFQYRKPLWIVPQMFGGSEWWHREPTPAEVRRMTYDAVFHGATGIQYFVRHGHASFPKSPQTWDAASRIAFEMQEVTPFFASADSSWIAPTSHPDVKLRMWSMSGRTLILALSTSPDPITFSFSLPDTTATELRVVDSLRRIELKETLFHDVFAGMGARWYSTYTPIIPDDSLQIFSDFEQYTTPGFGYGYYTRIRGDRGATAILDTRVSFQGNHSLRITSPTAGKELFLRSFPYSFEQGKSYRISVMAKAKNATYRITENRFLGWLFGQKTHTKTAEVILSCNKEKERFPLTESWQKYSFEFTYSGKNSRKPVFLELAGKGSAWFDLLTITPLR